MKKVFFAATAFALALTIGSAFAADLPRYKAPPPPPPPPPPMWTGFYVGLNAGYTWSSSNSINFTSFPGPCDPASGGGCTAIPNYSLLSAFAATGVVSANNSGFIGGGQIGYNWQFYNGAVVAGVEADIQGIAGSNQRGTFASIMPSPAFPAQPHVSVTAASRSLDYLGTVRGRLGWLFTPTLLVYGTGGLAYGGVSLNYSIAQQCLLCSWTVAPFAAASFADTRVGWTAGGGLEWMFMPNWSAKIEYLYYDLGNVSLNSVIIGTNPANGPLFLSSFPQARTRFDGNIVRAGVNYHFNWAAPPVVAKY